MYASVFVTSNNKVRIGLHLRLHECGSKIPKQFEIGQHRSGDAFQFVRGKKESYRKCPCVAAVFCKHTHICTSAVPALSWY